MSRLLVVLLAVLLCSCDREPRWRTQGTVTTPTAKRVESTGAAPNRPTAAPAAAPAATPAQAAAVKSRSQVPSTPDIQGGATLAQVALARATVEENEGEPESVEYIRIGLLKEHYWGGTKVIPLVVKFRCKGPFGNRMVEQNALYLEPGTGKVLGYFSFPHADVRPADAKDPAADLFKNLPDVLTPDSVTPVAP